MTEPTSNISSPALIPNQETQNSSTFDKARHLEEHDSKDTLPPSIEHDEREKPPSISLSSSASSSTDTRHRRDSQGRRSRSLSRTVSEVRDGIANQRDPELGHLDEHCEKESPPPSDRDPNLVTWDGPEDPQNPKQWKFKKKWAAVVVGTVPCPIHLCLFAPG